MSDELVASSGFLTIDELAYLLASVSAETIIGFERSVFEEANISRGLQLLKEHDSLVARDGGWSLNPGLFLLAAILAAPERAMTVTVHNVGQDGGEVGIAYFEAQGTIVEIKPADGGVAFTMANNDSFISLRATQIGNQLEVDQETLPTLQVAAESFAAAMKAPDRQVQLDDFFLESLPDDQRNKLTNALVSDAKVATVEGVGFLGRTPVVRKDLYCVGSPAVLVAGEKRPGTSIYLSGFSTESFVEYVDLIWQVTDMKTPNADADSELAARESR